MKKEHALLIRFAAIMLVMFIGQAFTFTLMIPYLSSMGYNTITQGWIFAFGSILTIVGQFLVGYLCDKFKTDKIIFIITCIIFAIVNWLFYSFNHNSLALVFLWGGFVFSLFRITQGVLDSWVIESDKYCLDNYGRIRIFGAIGWAIGAPLTSKFFDLWGYASLGTSFLFFTVATLIITLFIPDAQKVETGHKLKFSDVKELVFDPHFIVLTLMFLFLSMIMTADGYTTIYKMIALGSNMGLSESVINEQINLKYSFQAVCELPLFFFGGWVVNKFGNVKTLAFVTVMVVIRFVLYGLAVEPMQIVWASAFQAVTFPLYLICTKRLIDEASPAHLRASGQQISAAIFVGCSALITPVLCGFLVEVFSFNITLFSMAATCIVPLLLLMVYSKMGKISKE